MLEIIALAVMNGLTSLVKRIPAFSSLPDGWHKTVIRVVVLVFAYLSSISVSWMSGDPIDLSPVAQALPTVLMFLSSQGLFFLFNKKTQ